MKSTEKNFPRILQVSHDAIVITDQDQNILFFNQSAERIFGYTAKEITGKRLEFLLPLPLTEIHDRHFKNFSKGRRTSKGMNEKREVSGRHKDGTIFPAEASISKFKEDDISFFSVNLRDITERKQVELERASLLHDLGERVKELTILHQAARLFQTERRLDQQFLAELAGFLPPGWQYPDVCEARITYKGMEAVTPGWQDSDWKQSVAFKTSQGTGMIEIIYLAERPILDEGPFLTEERALLESLAEMLEAHLEHRHSAENLFQREAEFRAIFENAGIGMALMDLHGFPVTSNPQLEEFLGYSKSELTGMALAELTHPDDVESDAQLYQSLLAGEREYYIVEKRYIRKDGQTVWGRLTASLVREGNGTPRFGVAMIEDVTARKEAEEKNIRLYAEATRRLQHIQTLRLIDAAIASNMELRLILNLVLEQALPQLEMDAASILLLDPPTSTLNYAASRGFYGTDIERSSVRLGEEDPAGRAAEERKLVIVHDLTVSKSLFSRASFLKEENFIFHAGTPLIVKGEIKGVLEVFKHRPYNPEVEWRDFFTALAGQITIAMDNSSMFAGIQRSNADLTAAYDETLAGWSRAMDFRDKETEGHTQRVTEMALKLAHAMGVSNDNLIHIRRGALLHDIGKVGVPDNILLKPDILTPEEWLIMRRHPEIAYEMLSPIHFLQPALDIPYCHHEKWDGTGYPCGLKGEQIPLFARIFAVADVWDALRSDRPYRKGWSTQKVMDHIQALSGSHFDPHVVDSFLKLIQSEQPST